MKVRPSLVVALVTTVLSMLLLSSSPASAQANILINGDFETGALPPWVGGGLGGATAVVAPAIGTTAAQINSAVAGIGTSTLSQGALTLEGGRLYFLEFFATTTPGPSFHTLVAEVDSGAGFVIVAAPLVTSLGFSRTLVYLTAAGTVGGGTVRFSAANFLGLTPNVVVDNVVLGLAGPEIDTNAAAVPLAVVLAAFLIWSDGRRRLKAAS